MNTLEEIIERSRECSHQSIHTDLVESLIRIAYSQGKIDAMKSQLTSR